MTAMIAFFPSLLLAGEQLLEEEEINIGYIVITATRNEQEVEDVTSAVTVVTNKEIERKQPVSALEVLRGISGIDVVQTGGLGRKTSIFIRGGESDHTLVMIDGMQVNSPNSGSYNFGDLMSDNIERIEIIRGPQSTLYGSDALTGVINIITKKGTGPAEIILSAEGGSYETYKERASVSGGSEKVKYSFSASRVDSKGFSAASEKDGNSEKDGYGNTTVSGRAVINMTKKFDVDLSMRYTDADTDLDAGAGSGGDDPYRKQEVMTRLGSVKLNHHALSWYSYFIKLAGTDEILKDIKSGGISEIKTRVEEVDWQNDFSIGDINILTVGYEYEKKEGQYDSAKIDHAVYNNAIYIQDQLFLFDEDLSLSAGMRRDDHSKFGDEVIYQAGISYKLAASNTRFMGNWGEGFKAPTLNDLYFNTGWAVGNPDLKPEKSTGYDIGIEQWFGKRTVRIGGSYFNNRFKNLIAWDWSVFPMTPKNVSRAETKGWEFGLDVKPHRTLLLSASCTVMDTEDEATGNELARRPKNKGSVSATWTPGSADFNLTINKVGRRWNDSDNIDKLKSYTKVDFAASFDLTKNLSIFGRGENLLNEDYEEVKGYGTAGISYYGGIKVKF